jgi:hypothetical protein
MVGSVNIKIKIINRSIDASGVIMKINGISRGRFSSPSILTENTFVLGIAAKTWDEAFTGNMNKTLIAVEQRARAMQRSICNILNRTPK